MKALYWTFGILFALVFLSHFNGPDKDQLHAEAMARATSEGEAAAMAQLAETPAYTGDCPVYGITLDWIDEYTSLYDDSSLHADRRKKGFIPPGTKLCITAVKLRGTLNIQDFEVSYKGYTGWTSEGNLKGERGQKVHVEPGAGSAAEALQTTRRQSEARGAAIVSARRHRVIEQCYEAARAAAVMPETVDLKGIRLFDWTGHKNGVILKAALHARNAFNVPVSFRIECMLDNNGFDHIVF